MVWYDSFMLETFLIGGISAIVVMLFIHFPKPAFGIAAIFVVVVLILTYVESLDYGLVKKKHYEGAYYQYRGPKNINGKSYQALPEGSYNIQMGGGVVRRTRLASDPVRRCDQYNNLGLDDPSYNENFIDFRNWAKENGTYVRAVPGSFTKARIERCIAYAKYYNNQKLGIYLID